MLVWCEEPEEDEDELSDKTPTCGGGGGAAVGAVLPQLRVTVEERAAAAS